jgi:hypothetical protein
MKEHELLIEKFYKGFRDRDWRQMVDCYHPQVEFSDPVFLNLTGKQACAMWHMLVSSAKDLEVTWSKIETHSEFGSCYWEAKYSFSKTGRKVHNTIAAKFKFEGGKIILHNDQFDLWRWSRMALGVAGTLLGWSAQMKRKIRGMAMQNLYRFIEEHPEYK